MQRTAVNFFVGSNAFTACRGVFHGDFHFLHAPRHEGQGDARENANGTIQPCKWLYDNVNRLFSIVTGENTTCSKNWGLELCILAEISQ
jgi:hypothetical protein